jgi:hypothetical protein
MYSFLSIDVQTFFTWKIGEENVFAGDSPEVRQAT